MSTATSTSDAIAKHREVREWLDSLPKGHPDIPRVREIELDAWIDCVQAPGWSRPMGRRHWVGYG